MHILGKKSNFLKTYFSFVFGPNDLSDAPSIVLSLWQSSATSNKQIFQNFPKTFKKSKIQAPRQRKNVMSFYTIKPSGPDLAQLHHLASQTHMQSLNHSSRLVQELQRFSPHFGKDNIGLWSGHRTLPVGPQNKHGAQPRPPSGGNKKHKVPRARQFIIHIDQCFE